jgi:hypothetical protein
MHSHPRADGSEVRSTMPMPMRRTASVPDGARVHASVGARARAHPRARAHRPRHRHRRGARMSRRVRAPRALQRSYLLQCARVTPPRRDARRWARRRTARAPPHREAHRGSLPRSSHSQRSTHRTWRVHSTSASGATMRVDVSRVGRTRRECRYDGKVETRKTDSSAKMKQREALIFVRGEA